MTGRKPPVVPPGPATSLLGDIRALIDAARRSAALAVNSELTALYWRIGRYIHTRVLDGQRAVYGEDVLPRLASDLVKEYGRSFSVKNLRRMVQFAVAFPEERIVVSLIRQLSWTHFIALIPLKDPLKRDYYAQVASAERWSVRTLRERIDAAYKGQMELYLRWLDKHEREAGEAPPLGIILCTGKKSEQIELLELDKSGIHVAEYLTTLPPRAVLLERLQLATQRAQRRLEQRDDRPL